MVVLTLFACKDTNQQTDDTNRTTQVQSEERLELPEDFTSFYNQFHTDGEYQLNHILWPLKGLPDQVDAETLESGNFYFKKDEWVMHRPLRDPDQEFDQYFAVVDDGLIIEKIESKVLSMSMERRFAKMDTAWYLIYYQGMNQIK